MRLELGYINVKDVKFGAKTEFKDGIVYVNKAELLEELKDERLAKLDLDIVHPGESVRICPV
ncbi:MAG: glycine/sarcosine/betaine reductase component B subunit, partial [Syntrophomonadaceae bacterium]|nr:glycine/sarcosine/betaine reductase component B subunit [Syntrophomonadaceae bacterium]MDD4548633.1 glycine/sarcosine/betaine reductase component B subunit [Syntrophomonadaceae bacterium]